MATEYLKDKQKLKGVRVMLFAVAMINAAVSVIFRIITSFKGVEIPVYFQALITGLFAYILPILIYAKINNITAEKASERFFLKKTKLLPCVIAILMGIGCQFVMVFLNLPVNLLIGNNTSYLPRTGLELCIAMFVIAVLPAIFEEFLFRGVVLGSLSELNSVAAIVFSSVMFAVLHGDINGFVGYLFMGVMVAVVVKRTGSLYSGMLFHLFNNITALLLGYFNSELAYVPGFMIGLFIAGAAEFIVTTAVFLMITKRPEKITKIKTSQLLGQCFLSLPIILCVLGIVFANMLIEMI